MVTSIEPPPLLLFALAAAAVQRAMLVAAVAAKKCTSLRWPWGPWKRHGAPAQVKVGDHECWGQQPQDQFQAHVCCTGLPFLEEACFPPDDPSGFSIGRCCRARVEWGSPAQAMPRSAVGTSAGRHRLEEESPWLTLKLRFVVCAYGGGGESGRGASSIEPPKCGRRCLELLQGDLTRLRDAAELAAKSATSTERTAGEAHWSQVPFSDDVLAVLCWRLLRLCYAMRAPLGCRGDVEPMLEEMLSLWEVLLALNWSAVLRSGWPVFGLLGLVRSTFLSNHWAEASGGECRDPSKSHVAFQEVLQSIGQMDFLAGDVRVEVESITPTCDYMESITRWLLVILFVELHNLMRLREFHPEKGYVPAQQMEGNEEYIFRAQQLLWRRLSLHRSRSQVYGDVRMYAADLLEGTWSPLPVLHRLEAHWLLKGEHLLRDLLPAAPVILEVGANDGVDVAGFLASWPDATVHAFEPDPDSWIRMHIHLESLGGLNSRRRTTGGFYEYNVALTDQSGMVDFFVRTGETGWSAVNMIFRPNENFRATWPTIDFHEEPRSVKAFSLDDWASMYGVMYADYAEIDAQCAEYRVLSASTELLPTLAAFTVESCVPPGMCEGGVFYDELAAMLRRRGFHSLVLPPTAVEDVCFDVLFVNQARGPARTLWGLQAAFDLDAEAEEDEPA
eukprot:gnl/TRDRNA2_/TRDRNA2_90148_c0_seq1.p1 gnl/TRDRNA2_/TRDRNA2_90148_c0~~gnl/TRDRNA2_/TRDRNA2_90148_c0_seq1.p1  ORF type:complete len:673 (-),score=117.10 gnl/TRDRNA2_/TRDRNA2_90148_c0_seq1:104-2122(-)